MGQKAFDTFAESLRKVLAMISKRRRIGKRTKPPPPKPPKR